MGDGALDGVALAVLNNALTALTSSFGFAPVPVGVGEGLEEAAGVTGLAAAVLTTLSSETVPKVMRLGPSEDSDGATAEFTGTGDDGSAIVPNDKVGARQEKSEYESMSKNENTCKA